MTEQDMRVASFKLTQLVWLLFGLLEGLIALRVGLKLVAANPANPFAAFVYGVTDLFLWPFFGLTATPAAGGMVLEIPSIIAMLVYALVAWALATLLWILLYNPRTRVIRRHTTHHHH